MCAVMCEKGIYYVRYLNGILVFFCFSCTLHAVIVVFQTAVKCNDSPVVLALLAHLGTGFDCASKVSDFVCLNLCQLAA